MIRNLIFKFSKNKKSTPKKVVLDIKGFTEYHNRNGFYFTFEDLLNGPEKIPVKDTHEGKIFANTYFVDRKVENDKQGKVLNGQIVSENKEFIEKIEELTGFSIELDILRDSDLFQNEDGEFIIKQGGADFRAIAALYGELPGSGGTEILNKKFEFSFGSRKVPKNNLQTIKYNNMDYTKEQLDKAVANAVQTNLKAFFEAQKKEQEEAKKVTFSLKKDATVDEVIKAVKKQFNFELVEKEDEAAKLAKKAKEADMQFSAQGKSKPVKAGEDTSKEDTNYISNFINKF